MMRISEAESVVMEVLWNRQPLSADEVVEALGNAQQWQTPTIKTLLNRLLKKAAISAEKDGRRYLYSPVLERKDWVQDESQSLLQRLFDGRVAPLVAHFSQQRKLSDKDIRELRKLLEDLDDDRR
jgi:predicted transcriptional regulator